MYVGFLNDTMFKKQEVVYQADQIYNQLVADRQLRNYFNVEMVVNDNRSKRLTLGGKIVPGKLSYHYDGKRHEVPDNRQKDDMFKYLSNAEIEGFFNIVEMIAFANGASESELNTNLSSMSITNKYYINNSLVLSKNVVAGTIYNLDGLTPTTKISLVTWFQFDVEFPDRDPETIKVFLDRPSFMADYPYTTINNVIMPCDPIYILEPSKIPGITDAVIKSSEFSFKDLDPSIVNDDHTGLLTYFTKYITKSKLETTIAQMLPFGILYQGAKPTSLAIREAIRNEILKLDLATQTIWETILPDLFVTAQFFMVPIWDNYTVRPQGILYPSVINAEKLVSVIPAIFSQLDSKYIEKYQEIITCGQSELFIATIPDPLNKDEFSILKKHPTYQLHMAQDGNAFVNQDPATRDFNQRFNRAMAVACGSETQWDVITQKIDDLTWHSFTAAKTEYNVLSQESYFDFFKIKV